MRTVDCVATVVSKVVCNLTPPTNKSVGSIQLDSLPHRLERQSGRVPIETPTTPGMVKTCSNRSRMTAAGAWVLVKFWK